MECIKNFFKSSMLYWRGCRAFCVCQRFKTELTKVCTFSMMELTDSEKEAYASCYRTDVKNEDIIEKYQSGMSIKQSAENYSMTENGMRRRLKELGVWEDRRFTANKVTCS